MGSGKWSASFFGPNAADDASPAVEEATTVPNGVAGQFDVSSSYTNVVGAFAAKKK